jgi:hypothetical protein
VVWGRLAWFKWALIFTTASGARERLFQHKHVSVVDLRATVIGLSSPFVHAAGHTKAAAALLVVWDWWYFIVNTGMTASIFGKIV